MWTPYFTMSRFHLRQAEELLNMTIHYITEDILSMRSIFFYLLLFFYVHILFIFGWVSHPFYVLFGAISRLGKPALRSVSQPHRHENSASRFLRQHQVRQRGFAFSMYFSNGVPQACLPCLQLFSCLSHCPSFLWNTKFYLYSKGPNFNILLYNHFNGHLL